MKLNYELEEKSHHWVYGEKYNRPRTARWLKKIKKISPKQIIIINCASTAQYVISLHQQIKRRWIHGFRLFFHWSKLVSDLLKCTNIDERTVGMDMWFSLTVYVGDYPENIKFVDSICIYWSRNFGEAWDSVINNGIYEVKPRNLCELFYEYLDGVTLKSSKKRALQSWIIQSFLLKVSLNQSMGIRWNRTIFLPWMIFPVHPLQLTAVWSGVQCRLTALNFCPVISNRRNS